MKDTPLGDVRCDDILSWRNGKKVTEELESVARDTKFLLPFDFDQFPNSHLILEKWRARSWAFTRSEKKNLEQSCRSRRISQRFCSIMLLDYD